MSKKFKYKQNDIVDFKVTDTFSGFGIICGTATIELPVMGTVYIVKVLDSTQKIPNADYPFDCICIPENQLTCRQ